LLFRIAFPVRSAFISMCRLTFFRICEGCRNASALSRRARDVSILTVSIYGWPLCAFARLEVFGICSETLIVGRQLPSSDWSAASLYTPPKDAWGRLGTLTISFPENSVAIRPPLNGDLFPFNLRGRRQSAVSPGLWPISTLES